MRMAIKRKYERPTTHVVQLQQRMQLLQMSGRGTYDPEDDNPFVQP